MPSLSLRSVAATLMLVVGGRAATAQKYLLVVNPRNPVARLDAAQVSRIYLGKLQAWNINGDLQPVAAVDQPADSRVDMTQYLAGIASTADEISAGRLDATVTPRGASDRFGHAFVRMTQSARSETLQDLIRRFRGAGAPGLTLARSA